MFWQGRDVMASGWLVDGVWRAQQYSQQLNLQLQMADKDSSEIGSRVFSLVRLRAQCKLPPVRVDFTTPLTSTAYSSSIVPTFNCDRLFCTPAFLLPTDQKYFQQNLPYEERQFEDRIKESLHGVTASGEPGGVEDVWLALPGSSFCQICQEKFEDYPHHIRTQSHLLRQASPAASAFIIDLASSFTSATQSQPPRNKTKPIHKQKQEKPLKRSEGRGEKQKEEGESESGKGQNFSTGLVQSWSMQAQTLKF